MNMIADVLSAHIDAGDTYPKEIAHAADVGRSTAYRWIGGESEPEATQITRLLEHLPAVVADSVLAALVRHTRYVIHREDATGDVNSDGRVDGSDALDQALEVGRQLFERIQVHRERARREGITPQAQAQMLADAQRLQQMTNTLTRIVAEIEPTPVNCNGKAKKR